jgi:hypothetical protein
MFHKVKNVIPIDNYELIVEFVSGGKKRYDIKPLVNKWGVFKDLYANNLFNQVKVDVGGFGIVWNENIDLSCNELWDNGETLS